MNDITYILTSENNVSLQVRKHLSRKHSNMPKAHMLALMMIVKNEASIIADTLDIISKHFGPDYWVISDTGSTDDTKAVIERKMDELGIPGQFADCDWSDFSTNRNHVLNEAVKHAEYVVTFDADDGIDGSFVLPELSHDMYRLRMQSGGASYHRPFILSSKRKWEWVGVLHEYVRCVDAQPSVADIEGDYFVRHNRVLGCRSSQDSVTKFSRDGDILSAAILDPATPKSMIPRYVYYAAQSYRDAGQMDRAVPFFKRTTEMDGGWSEERYLAAMELARHANARGDRMMALEWYGKAGEFSPSRVEWAMESAGILETVSKRMALGVLTSISADKVAEPGSGAYFVLDVRMHTVYFVNRILFLASDCGRHDLVPPYLEMQAKRSKWLTDEDISHLVSNIEFFSSVCGPDAVRCAKSALASRTTTMPRPQSGE